MSGSTIPRTPLRRVIRPWAKRLGRYPSRSIARITRAAVVGATSLGEFRMRLTVAVETPAASATSSMETGLRGLGVVTPADRTGGATGRVYADSPGMEPLSLVRVPAVSSRQSHGKP